MNGHDNGLARTLDLLRRVLLLEQKQGHRNTAATGGVYRYFRHQFAQHDYDATSGALVENVMSALQRYEAARGPEERRALSEMLLRRLDGNPAPAPEPIGPVDAAHSGASAALRLRRGEPQTVARMALERAAPGDGGTAGAEAVRPRPAHSTVAAAPSAAPAPRGAAAPAAPAPAARLDQPLREAVKMRAQEAEKLERLGLVTVEDALYHLPRDHYDCRNPLPIHRLRPGLTTTIIGTLQGVNVRRTPRKQSIVEAKIADDTAALRVTWFSQYMGPLLRQRLGQRVAVSGHVELSNGHLQFVPRDYEFPDDDELTHTGRLVPIYALTEGLTQRWMRGAIKRALDAALHLIQDPLPDWMRAGRALPGLAEALRAYHFPADEDEKAAAMRRLAFDELLYVSIGMARRKRAWQHGQPARPIAYDREALHRYIAALPFTLTGAQRRALAQVLDEIEQAVPMSRLVQGDVGSGKTVVAAAALYMAACAGLQGAIMAPTEILAEQHYRSLLSLLKGSGVDVALLTGSVKGAERRRVYAGVAAGEIPIVVGTHALIQEGVSFDRLALAVIDEQHRFGVQQRASLRQKGFNPHVLAMTATPIPRTLQLTIYGDLDVSVIDERPPGRLPVVTSWAPSESQAFALVREQVALGRQAFVICPLVEESDKSEARAAVAEQRRLQSKVFPALSVGLLHGQMKPAEKEATLARFRDGAIDVLVATSVVEVGIDVPNATVMVVEEAHRFGLAQLHQLRGRVGRGADQAYCVLLADSVSAIGQQRLKALESTDDGFALAAIDLELRGPGEFLGTRQSGLPSFRVAGVGDTRTVEEARGATLELMERDPELTSPDHALLAANVQRFWDQESERS